MADLIIEYDDSPDEVVRKISQVLSHKHGLVLKWDETESDGGLNIVKRKDLKE